MFERILIICTGNICRSPIADVLLNRQLSLVNHNTTITSAGTDALLGFPADEPAQALMLARGLDLSAHRARQVSLAATRKADLILVMQKYHLESIVALDPTARGKTFLLGHWTAGEIPDPYQRGDEVYAQVMALIDDAVDSWVTKIVRPPSPTRAAT